MFSPHWLRAVIKNFDPATLKLRHCSPYVRVSKRSPTMSSTPIRLSWKPIESSISDNHGNIVLNYEVALPEGIYSVQATENSHTHRFGGYVV